MKELSQIVTGKRGEWMAFNKKGSLEISIQAIVIVVLAMTLLGLGLGFVRGMFKNIGGLTEQVTEDVRQKIGRQLIEGDEKIAFPRSQIEIKRGEAVVLDIGIRNKGNLDMSYKMIITKLDGPTTTADPVGWFQYDKDERTLGTAEFDVRQMRLDIPSDSSAVQGSYYFTFEVTVGSETYATKDFFVVVRG